MHVEQIAPEIDLVDDIRRLNASGVRVPWAWTIAAGSQDPLSLDVVTLTVGVHNTVGVLLWTDETADYVPAGGSNTDWLMYRLGGVHETSIPPRAEVIPQVVYAALAEFLETRKRPTNIEWREVE